MTMPQSSKEIKLKDVIHIGRALPSPHHFRVFLIPGNPGLISFYEQFLADLASQLENLPGCSFTIEGCSLAGFEVDREPSFRRPLSLQEQIKHVYGRVFNDNDNDNDLAVDEDAQTHGKENVILIGHSVGSYILLEILRHFYRLRKERELPYTIDGGICLFPTVVDIAKSPSGLKARWILNIPQISRIVGLLAKTLTFLMPMWLLSSLVRLVTGFPASGISCIVAFLSSHLGVQQALFMARDEMNDITTDKWDEEIWGSSKGEQSASSSRTAKLCFLFGQNDHWVAEETREQLVASRGYSADIGRPDETWRPRMDVAETGIPHAFCIRHSQQVAVRCAEYIKGIIS